jgi:hypothetical protein
MSSVIKKCPKDGIVYDATFTGNCASCFGPLKYFCKTHNDWLETAICPKCTGATPTEKPAVATPSATGGPSIVGVLAVLAICVGVFVLSGVFLYRLVFQKTRATTPTEATSGLPVPAPAAPQPTPPPPAPVRTPTPPPAPTPAAVELSLNQILADADRYTGTFVTTTGNIQFRDAARETFDLRAGDHILTVQYRGVPAMMKTTIAGASATQLITVTGLLQRDDADNSYSLVARAVALR